MNSNRRLALSSDSWVAYFQRNARAVTSEDFKPPATADLSPAIRAVLAASLPAWQLGESSDGGHLRAAARRHARLQNDPAFAEAVNFFILEEQRHAASLGDWLDRVGIPRKSRDPADVVFRWCRHAITNYAVCASVIVVAESIAETYYAAVRRITPCLRLQAECDRILRDEVRHIQFQCEHLAAARRNLPRFVRMGLYAVEFGFYLATCAAVYAGHGKLLRLAGYPLPKFFATAVAKFRYLQILMDPDRYYFPGWKSSARGRARQVSGV